MANSSTMYVDVAVNLPQVQGSFHYHLPSELADQVQAGQLVVVPFGQQRVQGIVLQLLDQAEVPETKPIEELLDPVPVLNSQQMELARWLESETKTPLIECLTLMLPPGLSQVADSEYELAEEGYQPEDNAEARLIKLLLRRGKLRGRQIERALSRIEWRRAANSLVRRGILNRSATLESPTVSPKRVATVRLAIPPDRARETLDSIGRPDSTAGERRRKIVELLIEERAPVEITWIYAETEGQLSDLRNLEKHRVVSLSSAEIWRDPLQTMEFLPVTPPRLTAGQNAAWQPIRMAIQAGDPAVFLLHGVTGSGKTEIYLKAVEEALAYDRGAMVLIPEIALTPQTIRRFAARFPGKVGLIHSELSAGERYDTWRRIRSGELPIVVGPRSALFAPLPRIGVIVLDESHDESYKQTEAAPRYHARESARAYAGMVGAVCLMGSATPDVVTYAHAQSGKIRLLDLPDRILAHRDQVAEQSRRWNLVSKFTPLDHEAESAALPPVQIVDMREELKAGNPSIFSRALRNSLSRSLSNKQQVILFLNRRGSASYVFCRDCGFVLRCPRCSNPLTYHDAKRKLLCHHCNYSRNSLKTCPECQGVRIKHFGAGTQRVQREIEGMFPSARTLRWDRDTTRTKGAHEVILAHFVAHRADVLIGTQMVAKGLDLPLVTLVGVISADTGLNLPDFRAAERTFQVLTQVAGRAGRSPLGGEVVLQTYHPEHYAIEAAANHDYQMFFNQELEHRKSLGYPPFVRLAKLVYRHTDSRTTEAETKRLAGLLRQRIQKAGTKADLIGPVPCYFQQVRGEYRWQIVLRSSRPHALIPDQLGRGWSVDIDPVSLL
jgi:primosomal protein N' (replication factor Y)